MQRLQTETQRLLQAERTAAGLPASLGSIRALAAELPEWSMVDTISHLQHQLALAIVLRDTDSFRTWLRTYVRWSHFLLYCLVPAALSLSAAFVTRGLSSLV